MIVVTVKVDWGQETIQEILPELKKHVEITLQEPGCDDFLFAVDVNNPEPESYLNVRGHVSANAGPLSLTKMFYQQPSIPPLFN